MLSAPLGIDIGRVTWRAIVDNVDAIRPRLGSNPDPLRHRPAHRMTAVTIGVRHQA